MRASHVISMAALGLTSRSYHDHWSDCNPIKRQSISEEDRKADNVRYWTIRDAEKKRERERARNGGKLLPCVR